MKWLVELLKLLLLLFLDQMLWTISTLNEGQSGRISDICNKFNITEITRIAIMKPCMDCSIKLTQR